MCSTIKTQQTIQIKRKKAVTKFIVLQNDNNIIVYIYFYLLFCLKAATIYVHFLSV